MTANQRSAFYSAQNNVLCLAQCSRKAVDFFVRFRIKIVLKQRCRSIDRLGRRNEAENVCFVKCSNTDKVFESTIGEDGLGCIQNSS